MELSWLPRVNDWKARLSVVRGLPAAQAFHELERLADHRLDFIETGQLDRIAGELSGAEQYLDRTKPLRLAMLGSSTLSHLKPGIRVGGLRRGFHVEIFEGPYGLYHHSLADPTSDLYKFRPHVVLLALDAHHIASGASVSAESMMERVRSCWVLARRLGASVIQQTALPIFRPLLGNNEFRYKLSPHSMIEEFNHQLRMEAEKENVSLLSVDSLARVDGISRWYDPAIWHRAKQEVPVAASPLYGDHVARILASLRGLSYKCMVLDLDNTLWGGVIGDDGVAGIRLGQGDALGEAFLSFQNFAKAMAARGVILAVCSKNDAAKAQAAFEEHPEMLLRKPDIACFIANWGDKAGNLRTIAQTLNIGLDSLVFVDDNPFERNLIRRELPMVAVPELPEDPALYEETIAAAGYFEALTITEEDVSRSKLYTENASRISAQQSATDITSYLKSLNMRLYWSAFDQNGLGRVTQLVNKSNQFNLTTRRYTQEELAAMMPDPAILTLQLRLTDAYGDNGIIAVVIGRLAGNGDLEIGTWLMSCRVLGRQVEEATLNLLAAKAKEMGASRLVGFYIPTKKNSMVQDHYPRLGFAKAAHDQPAEVGTSWILEISEFTPLETYATLVEATSHAVEGARDERTDICPAY